MSYVQQGAGGGSSSYDVLMNTHYVKNKATSLEAIGRDNKKITEEFEASTATLLKMGIKGLTAGSLGSAVDTILPETLKNPKRLISYALELAQSVTRTEAMDEELSTSFSVEDVKK